MAPNVNRPRVLSMNDVEDRTGSGYPPELAEALGARSRRRIGGASGIRQFGVNILTLAPGAMSAHRHWHEREDEFVYVLEGTVTVIDDSGDQVMSAGSFIGFPAGSLNAHHLVNRSDRLAVCLEIGSRAEGEVAHFPDADMEGRKGPDGQWVFVRLV